MGLADRLEGDRELSGEVGDLGSVGPHQLPERPEAPRITRLGSRPLEHQARSAAQHHLQAESGIEEEGVGGRIADARWRGLHAADDGVVPGVLEPRPSSRVGVDDDLVVHHLEAHRPARHHLRDAPPEGLGRLRMEPGRAVGLDGLHLLRGVEKQEGELVRRVPPLTVEAADRDLDEGGVPPDPDGRDPLQQVHGLARLHEEALDQLEGSLAGEIAPLDVRSQQGEKDLVEPSERVGDASVVEHHPEVNEPDGLEGLPEAPRRLGGNPPADLGDPEQLPSSLRVCLFPGHLAGELRVTRREADHAPAGDPGRAQELPLLGPFCGGEIEPGQPLLDPPQGPREPELHHHPVVGRAVPHPVRELVLEDEYPGRQRLLRLGREERAEAIPRSPPPPEGEDLGAEDPLLLLRDLKPLELARGEEVELVLDPGRLHLGEER